MRTTPFDEEDGRLKPNNAIREINAIAL